MKPIQRIFEKFRSGFLADLAMLFVLYTGFLVWAFPVLNHAIRHAGTHLPEPSRWFWDMDMFLRERLYLFCFLLVGFGFAEYKFSLTARARLGVKIVICCLLLANMAFLGFPLRYLDIDSAAQEAATSPEIQRWK